jgi:hypothetical protein
MDWSDQAGFFCTSQLGTRQQRCDDPIMLRMNEANLGVSPEAGQKVPTTFTDNELRAEIDGRVSIFKWHLSMSPGMSVPSSRVPINECYTPQMEESPPQPMRRRVLAFWR